MLQLPAGYFIPGPGVGVRRQTLLFLLFTGFLRCASGQQSDSAAITCTQAMAWSAGGMSSPRLVRLAQQRGIAFILDAATSQSLSAAGADPALLQRLGTIDLRTTDSGSVHSGPVNR